MNKKIIWVKCKCDDYYKLLKKMASMNIDVFQIRKEGNYLIFKVSDFDYNRLKKNLVSYSIQKYQKEGIFRFLDIIKKNNIVFLCIIIGIVIFFLLNNLIIDIDIIHENPEIRELIKKELQNQGVSVLTFKKEYSELNNIRQKILDKYSDRLYWIEIETIGMKYVVHIEERIINMPKSEMSLCNVYAKKSGLINSIEIKKGVATISIGDYVEAGDLLISGSIIYNDEIKSEVCASGIVHATRWYQISVNVPLNNILYQKSGKKKYNIIYKNEITTKKIFKSRFEKYDTKMFKIIDLFGHELYLEKEYELLKTENHYSINQAIDIAQEMAVEKMKLKLLEGESIIDKKVLKKTDNDSTIDVEIFIVTDEIIN